MFTITSIKIPKIPEIIFAIILSTPSRIVPRLKSFIIIFFTRLIAKENTVFIRPEIIPITDISRDNIKEMIFKSRFKIMPYEYVNGVLFSLFLSIHCIHVVGTI
jgi:hypothetical protein